MYIERPSNRLKTRAILYSNVIITALKRCSAGMDHCFFPLVLSLMTFHGFCLSVMVIYHGETGNDRQEITSICSCYFSQSNASHYCDPSSAPKCHEWAGKKWCWNYPQPKERNGAGITHDQAWVSLEVEI